MKKILALVLALMMVLTAVSAMAAGSPETPGGKTGGGSGAGYYADTTTEDAQLSKAGDTDGTKAIKQLLIDGNAAGDPLSLLPDDVKAKIPADQKKVNEMVTYQLTGDVSKSNPLTLVLVFETKYAEGEEVTILLGIPAGSKTEWIVLKGKGNKDGAVVVTLDKATMNKLGNNPFVVIPVSK